MTADKAYLLDTFVAGRQFYEADDVWNDISVGTALLMEGEPTNEHDAFAVSLWLCREERRFKIGYLPRSSNEFVAVMLAMGWGDAFDCVISRVDGSAPYDRQIGITVRIIRRPEKETADDAGSPLNPE